MPGQPLIRRPLTFPSGNPRAALAKTSAPGPLSSSKQPGSRFVRRVAFPLLALLLLAAPLTAVASSVEAGAPFGTTLHFEENRGQLPAEYGYLARSPAYRAYLSSSRIVLIGPGAPSASTPEVPARTENRLGDPETTSSLELEFLGARPDAPMAGAQLLPGTVSYFLGSEPSSWTTDIPTFRRLQVEDLYPGVDLAYYDSAGNLEFDLRLAPGVSPSRIRWRIAGARTVEVAPGGDLHIRGDGVDYRLRPPAAYQLGPAGVTVVESAYRLSEGNVVGFEVGSFDPSRPLVIDPEIVYSSHLGGSEDDGIRAVVTEPDRSIYVAGRTGSVDFPPGEPPNAGNLDAYVARLSPDGSRVEHIAFLGGGGKDYAIDLLYDGHDHVFVSGVTSSSDFPVVAPVQSSYGGGRDAFLAKLTSDLGSIVYSTYLGGGGYEGGAAMTLTSSGDALMTGRTGSSNFPLYEAMDADFDGGFYDCYLVSIPPAGGSFNFSTYFGGSGEDHCDELALDAEGNIHMVGLTNSTDYPVKSAYQGSHAGGYWDATVTKLDPSASQILFSTYLGGAGQDDHARGLALDPDGNIYVAGYTDSSDFPTVDAPYASRAGGRDGFLAKFDPTGQDLLYSTFLGGSGHERLQSLARGPDGALVATGFSASADFPTSTTPLRPYVAGRDAVVVRLPPDLAEVQLITYLGGTGDDAASELAIDSMGNLFIVGTTDSGDLYVTDPYQSDYGGGTFDGFFAKIGVQLTEPVPGFTWSPAAPGVGEQVQFTDLTSGEVFERDWDLDGDGLDDVTGPTPTWTYAEPGLYPVTLRVENAYGTESRTRQLVVEAEESAPVITSITPEYPGVFLEGVDVDNELDLGVEWAGTPGSIAVAVEGGSSATVPGTPTGGSFTLHLGSLPASRSPTGLALTPTNAEGVTGPTEEDFVYVLPRPSWVDQALDKGGSLTFTTREREVIGNLAWDFPDPPLGTLIIIPSFVPYLDGNFGITDTFASVRGEVSSLGAGSLDLSGQTEFRALGNSLFGKVGGSGEFRLFAPEGLELTGASFSLELGGTITKSVGVVEAIPQLASFSGLPGIRWVNERAQLVGAIRPSLAMTASFAASPTGDLRFREGTGTLGFDLEAILEVHVIPHALAASGWVGGGGSLTLGVPEPFVRELEAHVEAGVDYELHSLFRLYSGEFRCQAWCAWTAGTGIDCDLGGCGEDGAASVAARLGPGSVELIEHSYDEYGEYSRLADRALARRSSSRIPVSVRQESVLTNVFPGASPALVQTSEGPLLLWEHQDPDDPVLQSTEISWSLDDGSGWTAPQLVVDDTRVELAPVAAVDGTGRVVAAWTRIKDPAFSTPIDTTSDLPLFYKELEVVTATFDPVARTWSAVTPVTDNASLDTDLRLTADSSGALMLTWLENSDGELLSTADSPSRLRFSLWDAGTGTWSAPASIDTGLAGVAEHAPALAGSEAFVVVPRDPDPDTLADGVLDLYTWNGTSWSAPSAFAAGDVENRLPAAVYDAGGEGHVVWQRDGDLVWGTLTDPTPQLVRAGSDSMAFYGARFYTNDAGHLTLVWQEVVDNGPANLFARILDPSAATWSVDRRLTEEADVLHRDLSGFYGDDGLLRAAYLATEIGRTTKDVEIGGEIRTLTNLPEKGRTDLRVLEHGLVIDLAVDNTDLVLDPAFPAAGEPVHAALDVHNAGDFATGSFTVDLYAGDPDADGVLVGTGGVDGPFPGGAVASIPFDFTMPEGADRIVAVIDAADAVAEISELNNRAAAFAGNRPPVAIVTADLTRQSSNPLTASFDASASFDPDGDAITYSWAFGDGTDNASGATVSHTFADPGRFPVTLQVTDEHGAWDIATVLISTCLPDLLLTGQSVSGTATFNGCDTVTAHSGFTVTATGDVIFTAGDQIILGDGFSVESGGTFTATTDPDLEP